MEIAVDMSEQDQITTTLFWESVKLKKDQIGRKVTQSKRNAGNLVSLTSGKEGLPVYCIPTVSWHPTDFVHLAGHLPHRRLISFSAPAESDDVGFVDSVELIASRYVDAIVEAQPEGPLQLLGMSVGAIVALELAQQLKNIGRDVRLLTVVDFGPRNTAAENRPRGRIYDIKFSYFRLMRSLRLKRDIWNRVCQELIRNPNPVDLVRLIGRKRKERSVQIDRGLYEVRVDSSHGVHSMIDLANFPHYFQKFIAALFDAGEAYRPAKYVGPVLVFVATSQPSKLEKNVTAIWQEIADQAEFVSIKGGHAEIGSSIDLAKMLNERLEYYSGQT
jgi:thioesterase domain-containing protein